MHKLRAKYVIGHLDGTHVIYTPGEIIFEGNTVKYVGKESSQPSDICIDYGEAVISPGFIDLDACIDTDHALFDIAIPKSEMFRFEVDKKRIVDMPFQDEDFNGRHRYSMMHLLRNGITTAMPISGEQFYPWNFSIYECNLMVENAIDIGLRLYVGPSYKSRQSVIDSIDENLEKKSVQEAKQFVNEWKHRHPLIHPIMNPCQINVTSLEVLKETCYFAQENDVPFRIHACEAIREWNYTLENYGLTTISLFNKEAMLFNKFLIPHCITTTESELEMLAKTETSIVNTPLADLNFATALFSFEKYAHYGVNHTLGTDTIPGDMIRNLRAAWDLGRLTSRRKFFAQYTCKGEMIPLLPDEPDYPKLDAQAYYNAATVNGANAIGRHDLGRLQVGSKADIIVIDLQSLLVGGIDDPIRTVINGCTGSNVRDVYVDGRHIVENYAMKHVDEKEIILEYQRVFERFKELYQKYDKNGNSFENMFPPTYPVNPKSLL